jgi:hypothetical protein
VAGERRFDYADCREHTRTRIRSRPRRRGALARPRVREEAPGAAASLREGLGDTLMLRPSRQHRRPIEDPRVDQPAESMIGIVRDHGPPREALVLR